MSSLDPHTTATNRTDSNDSHIQLDQQFSFPPIPDKEIGRDPVDFKSIMPRAKVHVHEPLSPRAQHVEGEFMTQEYRTNFSFFDSKIAVSLLAEHVTRDIVVAISVAYLRHPDYIDATAEQNSQSKRSKAGEIMSSLVSELNGFQRRLERLLRWERAGFEVHRPLYDQEKQVITLQIRVDQDSNYDRIYADVKGFLANHKSHDERSRFIRPDFSVLRRLGMNIEDQPEPFQWTPFSMRAAEMAGITEDDMHPAEDFSDGRPLTHQEILRRQRVWNAQHPSHGGTTEGEGNEPSTKEIVSATLRDFFYRNI